MNTLVIDTDIENKINYKKSEINNKVCPEIDNINELIEIFKINPTDIFSCNTRKFLKFIMSDGTEYSLYDFPNDAQPELMYFSTVELIETDNDGKFHNKIPAGQQFYISMGINHNVIDKIIWQTTEKIVNVKQTKNRFSSYVNYIERRDKAKHIKTGYLDCQQILYAVNNYKKMGSVPAIEYCENIKKTVGNNTYFGYLPAAGELYEFFQYIDLINYIMLHFGFSFINTAKTYWTSTEDCENKAWEIGFSHSNPIISNTGKGIYFAALPFFEKH